MISTPKNIDLNDLEFDEVALITHHGDHVTTNRANPSKYRAPDVFVSHDPVLNQDVIRTDDDTWSLIYDASGQYGYRGPVMHSSEFIGSSLNQRIIDMAQDGPMLFCVTTVHNEDTKDCDIVGWAMLYRYLSDE